MGVFVEYDETGERHSHWFVWNKKTSAAVHIGSEHEIDDTFEVWKSPS